MINLRTIEEEDLTFLQEMINDPRVWRGIGRPKPVNRAQQRRLLRGDGLQ